MKFRTKLILGATALVCAAVTLCGLLMVCGGFEHSLRLAESRCRSELEQTAYHLTNRTVESEGYKSDPGDPCSVLSAARLIASATGGEFALCGEDGAAGFSTLPARIPLSERKPALEGGPSSRTIVDAGGVRYLLLATPLTIPEQRWTLLSAYDISDVYTARDKQVSDLLLISLAAIAFGAALAALFSGIATRPLGELERVSALLAEGDYSERAAEERDDEFGALARSFNSMAEAVRERVEQLRESVRQREDFAAALTHEIKTPMTSMMGYASLLQLKETQPGAHAKYAGYIRRETSRLERLSQKLLELMGLRDPGSIALERTDAGELFASLKRTLPELPENVSLTFQTDDVAVSCDRALADDLLRNLIGNSAKACEGGGSIAVRCERLGPRAEISVSDDGRGIPPDETARVAEPFYMVDRSRARRGSGSGIGLSLCVRIAELHGGALKITSALGEGTRVSFTLAVDDKEDDDER